jgi:hypothetical protein
VLRMEYMVAILVSIRHQRTFRSRWNGCAFSSSTAGYHQETPFFGCTHPRKPHLGIAQRGWCASRVFHPALSTGVIYMGQVAVRVAEAAEEARVIKQAAMDTAEALKLLKIALKRKVPPPTFHSRFETKTRRQIVFM